jgi:hypothetical protein
VSDADDEHGIHVEPEAEREHDGTVAPSLGCEQDAAGR